MEGLITSSNDDQTSSIPSQIEKEFKKLFLKETELRMSYLFSQSNKIILSQMSGINLLKIPITKPRETVKTV